MNLLIPTGSGLNGVTAVPLWIALVLNNPQRLICHKTKKPNQTKPNQTFGLEENNLYKNLLEVYLFMGDTVILNNIHFDCITFHYEI